MLRNAGAVSSGGESRPRPGRLLCNLQPWSTVCACDMGCIMLPEAVRSEACTSQKLSKNGRQGGNKLAAQDKTAVFVVRLQACCRKHNTYMPHSAHHHTITVRSHRQAQYLLGSSREPAQ